MSKGLGNPDGDISLLLGRKGTFLWHGHIQLQHNRIFCSLNELTCLVWLLDMSMSISAITIIAYGLTVVGSVPALYASYSCAKSLLINASAVCERAELWVHIKRTFFLPLVDNDASEILTGVYSYLKHHNSLAKASCYVILSQLLFGCGEEFLGFAVLDQLA